MDCHITLSLLCALLLTCYSAGQQSYVPYAWGQQQYEGEGYSNFEVNYIKTDGHPGSVVYTHNHYEADPLYEHEQQIYTYQDSSQPEYAEYVTSILHTPETYYQEAYAPDTDIVYDTDAFLESIFGEDPRQEDTFTPKVENEHNDEDDGLLKQLLYLANDLADDKVSEKKKNGPKRQTNRYDDDVEEGDTDIHQTLGEQRELYQRKKPGYSTRGGYNNKRTYKPVIKDKLIFSRSGFFVRGGSQLHGYYNSVQQCRDACNRIPNCLAMDYNRHARLCYTHYETSCDTLERDPSSIHFSKIPCGRDLDVEGVVDYTINIGRYGDYGFFMPWIKNIQDCIKTCSTAGGGLAQSPASSIGDTAAANATEGVGSIQDSPQLCFGVDYDVVDHKCWLHFRYWFFNSTGEATICDTVTGIVHPDYITELGSRSNIVHIVICPLPDEDQI